MTRLRAGVATRDITPPVGVDLCGFALRTPGSNALHDPLYTRSVTLSDGTTKVIISANDILSLSRASTQQIIREIVSRNGTAANSVNVATTHTHSGPATVKLKACGRTNGQYLEKLHRDIADTAARSGRGLSDVRIGVIRTKADVALNRRTPGGTVDPEVLAIVMEGADGKRLATICNYACHPVVLGHENNGISADYPGYLSSLIEKETGAPCLYLNGACGDINPVDAHYANPAVARKVGETVARKVIQASAKVQWLDDTRLQSRSMMVSIPVHQPKSGKELDKRIDETVRAFKLDRGLFSQQLLARKRRLAAGTYPQNVRTRFSLIGIGQDVGILFVPGELFASIGLKIKEMSPFRYTLISGFSNGTVGYLPTRKAYAEGGYEPHIAHWFYRFPEFDPSIEDVIVSGVNQLFHNTTAL